MELGIDVGDLDRVIQIEQLPEREREVVELHQFLEDWFNGVLPPNEQAFRRFADVMAPQFVLISPSGELADRQEVIDRLREAFGIWRRTSRPGRIWIENLRVRHQVGNQALVLYEEWQEIDGEPRGRLSTAVLQMAESAPNGVEWYPLHEVWLPE